MEILKNSPRVLVISHNAFSSTLNNGKTYSSIFSGWSKDKIAQLYFQNEIPDFGVCEKFFCISDEEMLLKAKKKIGKVVETDNAVIKKGDTSLHKYVRKKPLPIFSFFRNVVWSSAKWNNEKLNNWLDEFNPEAIFFVGGGNAFSYKITNYISNKYSIPVYLYYTDDYITPIKTFDIFWWINYKWLQRKMNTLLEKVNNIFVIGEDMGEEYSKKLNKKCIPIMNSVDTELYSSYRMIEKELTDTIELAYFGGLHLNRWKTLLMIAEVLNSINENSKVKMSLNIYSGSTTDQDIIQKFIEHPSINFKGSVNSKEIIAVMQKYDVLVHVESFEKSMVSKTRLSISTKIPEYLASGKVILGVGPAEVSSIRYLKKLGFVFIVDKYSEEKTKEKLYELLSQKSNFRRLGDQAVEIAIQNHSIEKTRRKVNNIISKN